MTTGSDAHHAAAWQAYWREVDAAAARHRQAVAQQRSDTAGQVAIGVGLILLYVSLIPILGGVLFLLLFLAGLAGR